jgi:hypothetical protein
MDRNCHALCTNTSCNHKVCEDCKEWNEENVVEMEAEDAAESDPSSDHTN